MTSMKRWRRFLNRFHKHGTHGRNHTFGHRYLRPLIASVLFSLLGTALIVYSFAAPTVIVGGNILGNTVPPPPAANPPLVFQSCTGGINIALLADVSGSITKETQDFQQMKNALKDFVSSLLPSTRTMFSLTQFDDDAQVMRYFTNNVNDITQGIDSLEGGGGTNWKAGLDTARTTFNGALSDAPGLLIFATDGDPTLPPLSAIAEAVTSANSIKQSGIHILVIGIGPNPTVGNLQLVSGNNVNTGGVNGDVITTDFKSLNNTLQTVAKSTCSSGTGTGGTGTGTGGTGKGTGGTGQGTGVGGSGQCSNGSGRGTNGSGIGSIGKGTGTSIGPTPQPSPTPTPSAPKGVQPTPQPTPQPSPEPAPSPTAVPTPDPTPTPAPTPMAQGLKTKPPSPAPSPFYDGKEYAKGSINDDFVAPAARKTIAPWIIAVSAVVLLGAGAAGYYMWKRKHPKPAVPELGKTKAKA